MQPTVEAERRPLPFSPQLLDSRGVRVVRRLQEAGFEAYFVGGCVRDLLLDRRPKDFDIATSARPQDVKRLFRRSRIIGRRFKLAHVYDGPKVYEVATFRRAPHGADDGEAQLIREDNVFGTSREDALRRDFTVNALFLDPSERTIVDFAGGLEDIGRRLLRSIGDPHRRFREDPVRVLRLIKFMRRLELDPGVEEVAAAAANARYVAEAAPPRVIEEVFRLMKTGDMEGVLEDLVALDILPLMLPELARWVLAEPGRLESLQARLRVHDEWVREGGEPSYGLSLAMLYGPMIECEFDPAQRTLPVKEYPQVPAAIFAELQARARLPRRVLTQASRILQDQLRMDPPSFVRRRKRFDPDILIGRDHFTEALEYLRTRLEAEGRDQDVYDEWHERALSLNGEG